MTRLFNVAIGLVLVTGLFAAVACQKQAGSPQVAQTGSPDPVPHPPLAPTGVQQPAQAVAPPNPEDQMKRTRVEEAIALAKAGDALIIDVRGTEVFKTQHIKGSIDFPLTRIEEGDFKGLPRNKHIIAYCA